MQDERRLFPTASGRIVWRDARRACGALIPTRLCAWLLLLVGLLTPCTDALAQPPALTRTAWQQFVGTVESRIAREHQQRETPLVLDLVSADARRERDRLLRGDVVVEQMPPTLVAGRPIAVPDGLIHHWRGAVYIPRMTVRRLFDIVQANPEQHKQADVTKARLLSRQGDHLRLFLQIQRTQIVTVTYNTEHDLVYAIPVPGFGTSRAVATRIAEVANAGTPREREKAAGDDLGFLWGLNAYWRYLQVGDGVMVECESLSLSREIPFLARPLVSPLVDRIARESMRRTLDALRTRLSGAVVGRS